MRPLISATCAALLLAVTCLGQTGDARATASVEAPGESAAPAEPRSILRAQVLLDRAHFSSGEIDGRAGSNLRKALAGFQRSRALEDDGRLGDLTWAALERDAVPTLVDYTLLAADVEGPYLELPEDLIERSKLPALGFSSLAEALGERFHASPALIRSLSPELGAGAIGALIRVPNVLDAPPLEAPHGVIVDRSEGTLMLVDSEGTVLAQFPASTGSTHDPLPIGEWKVDSVAIDPVFYYNPELFWNADPGDVKTQLPPGPNNPVGSAWIDLSKEHYGIHGTPEPSRIGKTESNGCIRLTNWSALLVAHAVAPGMPVLLRE